MTTHHLEARSPGVTLRLSWLESPLALEVTSREWEPARPEILPDWIHRGLVGVVADCLEAHQWPGIERPGYEHLAETFFLRWP